MDLINQELSLENQVREDSNVSDNIAPAYFCPARFQVSCSLNKLDQILERVMENPEYYTLGLNLARGHREMIRQKDIWKVAYIEDIPSCCRDHIGHSFNYVGFKHYMDGQRDVWFKELAKQFELREGKSPTDSDLVKEMNKYEIGEKYKLDYVLSCSKKVTFNSDFYSKNKECADWFLGCAELLTKQFFSESFPYFSIIQINTTEEKLEG